MNESGRSIYKGAPFLKSVALFTLLLFVATQVFIPLPESFAQSAPNTQVTEGDPVSVESTGQVLHGPIAVPSELGLVEEVYFAADGGGRKEEGAKLGLSPSAIHHPSSSPESLATPSTLRLPPSPKTIVFVQDAHDSLEAQENIAKIINHLVAYYGVKTVFEEGYEGPVPTDEFFGFIQDPALKEKVSYFFLDKLRIGGAEYAHINRRQDGGWRKAEGDERFAPSIIHHPPSDFQLIGADSLKLHKENIDQYRLSASKKETIAQDLKVLEKELTRIVDGRFPKPLKEWLKIKEQFDGKKLDLLTYLGRTFPLLPESTPGAKSQNYREADGGWRMERAVDRPPPSSIHPPIEIIPPLLQFLVEAAKSNDPVVLEKAKHIDAREVYVALGELEDAVRETFLKDPADKELFKYAKVLGLLDRLNDLQVTQEEYGAVKAELKTFDTASLGRFISEQTGRPLVLSKQWERNITDAIKFYEIAQQRDQSLANALDQYFVAETTDRRLQTPDYRPESTDKNSPHLSSPSVRGIESEGKNLQSEVSSLQSSKTRTDVSVLVFGGFHKENIKRILEAKGISYVIVSPRITKPSPRHENYYKQLMTDGKLPFEKNLARAVATAARNATLWSGVSAVMARAEIRAVYDAARLHPDTDVSILDRYLSDATSEVDKGTPVHLGDVHRSEVRRAEVREELDSFMASFEGPIYYPAAGTDFFSSRNLAKIFPKLENLTFADNFNPSEKAFPEIIGGGGAVGVLWQMKQVLGKLGFLFDKWEAQRQGEDLAINLTHPRYMDKDVAGRRMTIRYLIEDLFRVDEQFDAVFVQFPGMAGHLAEKPEFWRHIHFQTKRYLFLGTDTKAPPPELFEYIASHAVDAIYGPEIHCYRALRSEVRESDADQSRRAEMRVNETRKNSWIVRDTRTGKEKGFVYQTPFLPGDTKNLEKAWGDFHQMVFDFPKILEQAARTKKPVVLIVPENLDGFGPLADESPWIEGARVALAWASAYYRFKELGNVDVRVLQVPRSGFTKDQVEKAVKFLTGKKIKPVPGTPEEQFEARMFTLAAVLGTRKVPSKNLVLDRRPVGEFKDADNEWVRPATIRPVLPPVPEGKKRILVVGGAGFIGTNLVQELLAEGHQVIVMDSMVSANPSFESIFKGDTDLYLAKFDASRPFDVEGPVDQIIHLGSLASPVDYYGKPLETLRAGLMATREVLELARRKHARFLFTSTSEVYGDPKVHPQPETYEGAVSPFKKRSQYDESKRGAETLIKLYHEKYAAEGLDLRIARPFNTYGPYMRIDDGRVVTNFIQKLFANEPIEIYGDERITRSFGYIKDTLNGLLKLLRTDKLTSKTLITEKVFNIGNDGEFTLRALADLTNLLGEKYLKRTVPIRIVPIKDPTDPNRRRPDLTRARKILGYEPAIALREGFERTFLYFKLHPEALKGAGKQLGTLTKDLWKEEKWRRGVTVLKGGTVGSTFSDDNETLELIDERRQPTGEGRSKAEIHQEGLLHATAHVYLFDQQGRMLLQKRSPGKSASPGVLQVSVSGHVNFGEDPLTAALREGEEEVGLSMKSRPPQQISGTHQIKRSYDLTKGPEKEKIGTNNEFTTVFVRRVTPAEMESIWANYNLGESDELWLMSIEDFKKKIKDEKYKDLFSKSLHYMVENKEGKKVFKKIKAWVENEQVSFRSEVRGENVQKYSRRDWILLAGKGALAAWLFGVAACCQKEKIENKEEEIHSPDGIIFGSGEWKVWGTRDTGPGARIVKTAQGNFSEIKVLYKGDQLFSVKGNGYLRGVLPSSYRGPNGEIVDWGTSFVLPGYWSGGVYHHNPKLTQAEFWEGPDGTVVMNGVMEDEAGAWASKDFKIVFRKPLPESVEAEVSFTQRAAKNFSVDAGRSQNHEGWKALQFSSMNIGTAHDADFVAFQDRSGASVSQAVAGEDKLLFEKGKPLGQGPLYLANQEPSSWGYRPTTFIQMLPDSSPGDFSVQGWVARSSDPNDDNLGIWVHSDDVKNSYQTGETIARVHAVLGVTRPGLPLVAPSSGRSELRKTRSATSEVAVSGTFVHLRGGKRSEVRQDTASLSGPLAVRVTNAGIEASPLREDGGYPLDDFVGEASRTHAVLYQGTAAKEFLKRERIFRQETQVIVPAGTEVTVATEGGSFTLSEPGMIGMSHHTAASVTVAQGDVVVVTVDRSPAWYEWRDDSGRNDSGKLWEKGGVVVYGHRGRKNWYDLKSGNPGPTEWMSDSTTQRFPKSDFPPIVGASRVEYLEQKGVFSFHDLRTAENLHEHPVVNGNWELVETYMVTKGAAALVYFIKDAATGFYKPGILRLRPGDVAFVQPGTIHDLLAVEAPYEHVVFFTPSVHQYGFSFKRQVSDEEVKMDRAALTEEAMNLLRSEIREFRSAISELDEGQRRSEARTNAMPSSQPDVKKDQKLQAAKGTTSGAVVQANAKRSEFRAGEVKAEPGVKLREPAVMVVEKKRLEALSPEAKDAFMIFAAINKEKLYVVVPDLLEGGEDRYLEDLKALGVKVTLNIPSVAKDPKMPVIALSDKDQDTVEAFRGRLKPDTAGKVKEYFALEKGEGLFLGLLVAQPEDLALKNGFRYDRSGRYLAALKVFFQKLMDDFVAVRAITSAA